MNIQIKISLIYLNLSLVIVGLFWNYFFLFDLFSHFYLQLFIFTCILIPWYVWKKSKTEVTISGCLILFFLIHLIWADFSWILGTTSLPKKVDLFYMNTEYLNKDITPIIDYAKQFHPDQIAMVELNQELFDRIKKELGFKYAYYYPKYVFSFGFFTNEEVIEQSTFFVGEYPIGYFKTKDKSYYIIHPLPPMNEELYELQKRTFSSVNNILKGKKDFILVGDFNSTPYSQVFQNNFWTYFYKTIYSWNVNSILTIPIDHVISDKKIEISPWKKLSSDHNPLLINFYKQ